MDQVLIIKIISAILYPLGLVFLFIGFGCLCKLFNWPKKAYLFQLLGVAILIGASNPMVARSLVQSLELQYPQRAVANIEKHDAILVLGGGLRIPLPPALHIQLGVGSDRYWHAVQLFRAGKADKIILTGGNVFSQSGLQGEAFYASALMQDWGIPKSAIIIETNSRTTTQNFSNVANYLQSVEIESVLLVTSALHMPRALKAAGQLLIKVTPATADVLIREHRTPEILNWLPSASALALSTAAAHEYYGLWFADLKALIDSA